MTDKERLNTIKTTKYTFLETSKTDLRSDFAWLIERFEWEKKRSIKRFATYHKQRREIERLQKALRFYADKENYKENVTDQWSPQVPVLEDGGKAARRAMETEVHASIKKEGNEL